MTLPTPEHRRGSGELPPSPSTSQDTAFIAARAASDVNAVRDQADAAEQAVRIAAGLRASRPAIEREVTIDIPASRSQQFWGGLAQFMFGGLGIGAEKLGKNVNFLVDDFFSSIEKAGDANLKAQSKNIKLIPWILGYFLNPLVGIAAFFGGSLFLTPAEKSLREKDAEEEKKKKDAQKKKDIENDKVERLKKKGFSPDLAKALIEETNKDTDDPTPTPAEDVTPAPAEDSTEKAA